MESLLEALRASAPPASTSLVSPALISECDSDGLSPTTLFDLISAITSSSHAPLAVKAVRLLVPREPVDAATTRLVIRAYSRIASDALRSSITNWLCILGKSMFTPSAFILLKRAYAVFFHHLERDPATRSAAAQLLYLLTRRGDVTSYRAKKLADIFVKDVKCHEVLLLLELYAEYAPNWVSFPSFDGQIPGSLGSGVSEKKRARVLSRFLRAPEEEDFQELLKSIEVHAPETTMSAAQESLDPRTQTQRAMEARDAKRVKTSTPEARHGLATPSELGLVLVSEEETNRLLDAVQQQGSADPILLLAKRVRGSDGVFASAPPAGNDLHEMERQARYFNRFPDDASRTRQESFLSHHLKVWDGVSHAAEMTGLIARLQRFDSVDSLRHQLLVPLSAHLRFGDFDVKLSLFKALGELAHHWATWVEDEADEEEAMLDATRSVQEIKAFADQHLSDELILSAGAVTSCTLVIAFYEWFERAVRHRRVPLMEVAPPASLGLFLVLARDPGVFNDFVSLVCKLYQVLKVEAKMTTTTSESEMKTARVESISSFRGLMETLKKLLNARRLEEMELIHTAVQQTPGGVPSWREIKARHPRAEGELLSVWKSETLKGLWREFERHQVEGGGVLTPGAFLIYLTRAGLPGLAEFARDTNMSFQ